MHFASAPSWSTHSLGRVRRRHGYTVDLYRINLIHFFATRGSQHQYACSVAAEADAFRAKAREL